MKIRDYCVFLCILPDTGHIPLSEQSRKTSKSALQEHSFDCCEFFWLKDWLSHSEVSMQIPTNPAENWDCPKGPPKKKSS